MDKEKTKPEQPAFWTKRALEKLQFINEGTMLLMPIAKEVCPKVAENLAYYKNMEYALQGTIIVEIRLLKQRLARMEAEITRVRSLQPELFKQTFKTEDLNA